MEGFERIKKIGKGNFGDVLLVQRKSDQQFFALKRVDLTNRDSFNVDPLNEVKVLKHLEHPNIIKHYDSFIHNDKLCILMEYADNADLSINIKEHKSQNAYIKEDTILNWFAQLCVAIQHLHSQKILHRDIKVQNVFLSKEGVIKLGDFGISRTLENTSELAQTSIGTPFYLAPEICQSSQYNHKIDIWMLGCALYELCSLEKPFQGDSINAIVHKIMNESISRIPNHYSEFIADMIDWMLEKIPDQRPEISTIMQMPQMQKELWKLKEFYQTLTIKVNFPYLITKNEKKQPVQEEKKKQKQNINSIHYLVEKARQQQQQSPLYSKRSRTKMATQPQTKTNISPGTSPNQTDHPSQPNSPHFQAQKYFEDLESQNFQQAQRKLTENQESAKQRSYQRVMSINTQLENNYGKKQQVIMEIEQNFGIQNSEIIVEQGQQTGVKPKNFAFADQIFNPNAPTSPNRTILLTDFLKRKLGEEKFNQMKGLIQLLENCSDPMKVLDQERQVIQEILGENNMEYIKIFKILITSSVTPQASHFRTKSAQTFDESNLNCYNDPQQLESDPILELIKDVKNVDQTQVPASIGMNPWFEISFKNLKNYQE